MDDEILRHILVFEDEEVCDKEVDDSRDYIKKLTETHVFIKEELQGRYETRSVTPVAASSIRRREWKESIALSCTSSNNSEDKASSQGRFKRQVKVKVPKLELQKCSGKIYEFQEFWDGFSSAIDQTEELANVEKLKYLKGLSQSLFGPLSLGFL